VNATTVSRTDSGAAGGLDLRTAWIIGEMYYPEETNGGYILTEIAESIARALGPKRVRALCGQPNYAGRGTRAPSRETRHGVAIRRVRSLTLERHRVAARLLNQLTVTLSIGLTCLVRFRRGDVALVVTTPPILPFAVAAAAVARRARFVVLVHDLYPEALVVAGMARETALSTRLLRKLRRSVLRRAVRVITIGRDQRESLLADDAGLDPQRVVVVPNWADVDLVTAGDKTTSKMSSELGLNGRFVVQFAGNLGPLNGLEHIVDGIERLRSDPLIHFLFVGDGGRRPWLESEIERRELRNVTVVDWVPRAESNDMHRASDLVLISLAAGMRGVSVPSRTYNALASGRPILFVGDSLAETARVVREEGVGWVVPPGDVEAFVNAIREAMSDPDLLRRMGVAARHAASKRYARNEVLDRFREVVLDAAVGRA
jgi:colanic acid biosynthesis glycosyl transferase WcaI